MIENSHELAGKIALVTGATRGTGRSIAAALARAGADVAILGRGDASETAKLVEAAGRRAAMLQADVADPVQMEAAAQKAETDLGPIDILVCAAGMGAPRGPVWKNEPADFHACFDVNVLGVLMALRAVLPGMIARRSGRIIAIGGTYGLKGVADFAVYSASKWALRGLIKSTALEVGPHNITANIVAPGGVDGERLRAAFRASAERLGETEQQVLDRFTSKTALGRLVTEDDIAAAILHLAGERGRMITGQDFVVDAGMAI